MQEDNLVHEGRKVYEKNSLKIDLYTKCLFPTLCILHLNQSHFLTIRVDLNYNSMVSLQDDPISFSEGRNCIRKVLYSEPIDLYTKCLFPTL